MKVLRYLVVNGALAAAIYFGFFADIDGARRVAVFTIWALALLSLFLPTDTCVDAYIKAGAKRSVPDWVDNAFDWSVLVALVWVGAMPSAVAYLLHMAMVLVFRVRVGERMISQEAA